MHRGRFQNIEDYLQALKDMEEMEKLQKESEKQRAELEAQNRRSEEGAATEGSRGDPLRRRTAG